MDRISHQTIFVKIINWLTLPGLLLFVIYLRLSVGSHPPHMDEYGYLFVGRHLLSGLTWPTHSYIFGSDISWYLFGVFERYAEGYAGARIAAGLLGGLSLVGAYLFVLQLWSSRQVALLSTLLLAASANHIFISALATYDIVSFCFFTWAMTTAAYTARTQSYGFALLSAVLLSLAIICKYTTIVYLPLVGLVMLYVAPRQALLAAVVMAMGLALYITSHFSQLSVLYEVQIVGVHSANSSRIDIALRVLQQIGIPLYLWWCALLAGIIYVKGMQRGMVSTLMLLLIFSLPMPAYHFFSGNHISLYKHLNYSALFLFPAVASFLVYGSHHLNKLSRNRYLVPVLVFAYLCSSILPLHSIRDAYPDTTDLARVITGKPPGLNATVLSEDPYIFRYLSSPEYPQSNIKETTWLDNDFDGIRSLKDVKDALWDRKFELVLLTDQVHPTENQLFRKILSQRGYVAIYNKSYRLSNVMTKNIQGQLTLFERQAGLESQASWFDRN